MSGTTPHYVFNVHYGKKEMILVPAGPDFKTRAYPFTRIKGDYTAKDGTISSSYGCYLCRKAQNRVISGLPIVKVNTSLKLFVSNPVVAHICGPGEPIDFVRGIQLKRTVQSEVLETGANPTAALATINRHIVIKYGKGSAQTRLDIKAAMGSRATLKKGLQRARSAKYPCITAFDEIPDYLTETLSANPEPYMIGQGDEMLVMSSPENLRLLHESEFIMADGTFKYAPKGVLQVYRVFACRNGHWFPVVTALLCNKTEALYKEMWDVIYNSLQAMNVLPPNWSSAHFDCEVAAVNAFRHYYPNISTLMCLFHVRSNLNKQVQSEGLSKLYKSNKTVNRIVRRLGGIAMVPVAHMDFAHDQLSRSLPPTDAADSLPAGTLDKLKVLLDYFKKVWMNGPLGRNYINHYDNINGPRTTNVAESYHATQKAIFKRHHSRLGEWLVQFQNNHSVEEDFSRDVQLGRVGRKARDPNYLRLDAEITYLKRDLEYFLTQPFTYPQYTQHIDTYLSRMSYLIGCKGVDL